MQEKSARVDKLLLLFDAGSKGYLEKEEFDGMMYALGANPQNTAIRGPIGAEDARKIALNASTPHAGLPGKDLFEFLSKAGGCITEDSLASACRALGVELGREEAKEMLALLDADEKGAISLEEFSQLFQSA